MARARIIVVTSQRLDRLDSLLVAAGAERRYVVRVDDVFDLFEVETDEDCLLLLDLAAMPGADAGILRRWRERNPGARVVWVGGDTDRVAAFARDGVPGTSLRWPLDLDDLDRLAGSGFVGSRVADVPVAGAPAAGAPAAGAPTPEARADPGPEPQAGPGPPPAERRTGGNGVAELTRIEAILGRGSNSTEPEESADQNPAGADAPPPRVAFLATPPESTPESTPESKPGATPPDGPSAAQAAVETMPVVETSSEADPDPIDELDLPPGPVSRIDELGMDEPLLTKDEIDAFFAPPGPLESSDPLGSPDPHGAPEVIDNDSSAHAGQIATRRPAWLKDQTADLADIVQGLDLRARANHSHVGLEGELARLRQFTKTIGFVATPPPPGSQEFDLATLVEEQLGDLAGDTPDAPRLLFRRSPEGTLIQADKLLVAMALEALLRTAVGCAGAGDVVRVSVDARIDAGPLARVEFPAGPLSDMRPEDVLEPYALKSRLPQIGANALAAAGGIAVGQGGDLIVAQDPAGTLAFEISFSSPPSS